MHERKEDVGKKDPFSRCFSTLWHWRSHEAENSSFIYTWITQLQPKFFCLILRWSQTSAYNITLQMGTAQCTDLDKIAFLQNTFVFYLPKRQEIVSNKPQGCLSKIWKLSSSGDSHFKHMLCITEKKYVTLIVSKICLAKHLLFFLLCKICLFFPYEGHQTHIPQKNVTPDVIGGGCFYKFSTDLMFLKPLASKQRASSLLHHVLPQLWGLLQSKKDVLHRYHHFCIEGIRWSTK